MNISMSENTVCFRPQNQCWHLHTIDHSKHYILMHSHTDNSLLAFVSFGFLHQHLSTTFKLTIALSIGVCILYQFMKKRNSSLNEPHHVGNKIGYVV